jgi:hypothetical protein
LPVACSPFPTPTKRLLQQPLNSITIEDFLKSVIKVVIVSEDDVMAIIIFLLGLVVVTVIAIVVVLALMMGVVEKIEK